MAVSENDWCRSAAAVIGAVTGEDGLELARWKRTSRADVEIGNERQSLLVITVRRIWAVIRIENVATFLVFSIRRASEEPDLGRLFGIREVGGIGEALSAGRCRA